MPSRRTLRFTLLYFAEGAPIGFIWWTLPTVLRGAGVEVDAITGLTSLVVLPWALKFLWAPIVDALTTPRFTLRAWIVGAQLSMGVTLLPLLWIDNLAGSVGMLTVALVAHACCAATQDVAIDALAIATVPADARGALNGWMQAGMLLGRALFGGGALLLGDALSAPWMVGAMIAILWLTPGVLLVSGLPVVATSPRRASALVADLGRMLRQPLTWLALAFALTGEATFKGVGAVIGPFLVDHGVTEAAVGVFFGVGSVGAMVFGALAGEWLSDRFGRRRLIVAGQALMAVAVLGLAAQASASSVSAAGWLALVALYLGIGLFTAAAFALFMDLTDPRLAATQFSAYMGATNACEAWSSRSVGSLVTSSGYGVAFAVAAAAGTAALGLLAFLHPASPEEPEASDGKPRAPREGRDATQSRK